MMMMIGDDDGATDSLKLTAQSVSQWVDSRVSLLTYAHISAENGMVISLFVVKWQRYD